MNWWHKGLAAVSALVIIGLPSALAADTPEEVELEPEFIREAIACPADLETLTAMLLRDLPSYANRVNQRLFELDENWNRPGYVLIASQAEFEPLTLGPGLYHDADEPVDASIDQVFFTTLERQYIPDDSVSLQYHHWLFLTRAEQKWWVVTVVSQLAGFPEDQPLSPPEDRGQGVIARAVRLWLRDCHNQAVEPLGSLTPPLELGAAISDSANRRR